MHLLIKTLIVGVLLAIAAVFALRLWPSVNQQLAILKLQNEKSQLLLAKLEKNITTIDKIVQTANKAKNSQEYQQAISISKSLVAESESIINQLQGDPGPASKSTSFMGGIINFFKGL
jgi:predicted negative regulator of RcsB-dependent stress response